MRRLLASLVALVALASCATGTGAPEVRERTEKATRTVEAAGRRPRRYRFVVLGDFGTGNSSQAAVAQRMCRWRRSHGFPIVITTGDNIYDYGEKRHFDDRFYEPYRCLRRRGVHFHFTLGNHDVETNNGRPEIREPAMGMDGRRHYVLHRRGVRFVMFDSNNVNETWLRRATRPHGARWTVVAFHHPVYSPCDHGGTDAFKPWMPRLFRRRGVDLVLNGHDHIYMVTKSLRRIRYVVTGGGGADLYSCGPAWYKQKCRSRHHFLYVRTNLRRLTAWAVPPRGKPFDRFTTRGRR